MTTYKSDICEYESLRPAASSSQAGVLLASIGAVSLDAAHAVGDIIQLCKLPKSHEPVDFQLECDKLDHASNIKLSVGILNSDQDDLVADTNFLTDDTTAQGGGVARADVINGLGLSAGNDDRIVAAKIATGANFDLNNGGETDFWTSSESGTNEYYEKGTVSQKPDRVTVAGEELTEGTIGSLAEGEWGYGDNDTIGDDRIYIRLSGGSDPDASDADAIQAVNAKSGMVRGKLTYCENP